MQITILGGTGREGRGLALRWARAGHDVVVASRSAKRAEASAEELSKVAGCSIAGSDYVRGLARAEVVVVSVPYPAHAELLTTLGPDLANRFVIDITVPLRLPRVHVVSLPAGQAAALEAQAILGSECKIVATLHHMSSSYLADPDRSIDCDVLVCSDHDDARALGIRLVGDLGMRGLDAGPLCNAVALESLTPVLLHLGKRYGRKSEGIRFSGGIG
jgi:NADPH-dependent F420 reductase